jgi:Na+/melibiose symporter-like transporter
MLIAIIPGIISFISGIIMFFYLLNKKVMTEIQAELAQKKAAG